MRFVAERSRVLEVGAVTPQTGEPYCAADFRLICSLSGMLPSLPPALPTFIRPVFQVLPPST